LSSFELRDLKDQVVQYCLLYSRARLQPLFLPSFEDPEPVGNFTDSSESEEVSPFVVVSGLSFFKLLDDFLRLRFGTISKNVKVFEPDLMVILGSIAK